MASEAFLNSLSPAAALRFKAFLCSSLTPAHVSALLGDALPPASALDARAHERLLLALAAAAKVYVMDLGEAAVALRAGEGAGGAAAGAAEGAEAAAAAAPPLAPGHLQEAWRRAMLRGEVLGCGEAQQASAEATVREVAERSAAGGK
jgi:hypothetical protein